jgi:hypothetical protein
MLTVIKNKWVLTKQKREKLPQDLLEFLDNT